MSDPRPYLASEGAFSTSGAGPQESAPATTETAWLEIDELQIDLFEMDEVDRGEIESEVVLFEVARDDEGESDEAATNDVKTDDVDTDDVMTELSAGSDREGSAARPETDGANTTEDEARQLVEETENQLADIELALSRLDDGTFGRCEVCGRPIEPERLAERPSTRVCLFHLAATSAAR